jgi:hypothetical protein
MERIIRNINTAYKYLDILQKYGIKIYFNVLKKVII